MNNGTSGSETEPTDDRPRWTDYSNISDGGHAWAASPTVTTTTTAERRIGRELAGERFSRGLTRDVGPGRDPRERGRSGLPDRVSAPLPARRSIP